MMLAPGRRHAAPTVPRRGPAARVALVALAARRDGSKLLRWLAALGTEGLSQLRVAPSASGGLGIFARRRLEPSEVVP